MGEGTEGARCAPTFLGGCGTQSDARQSCLLCVVYSCGVWLLILHCRTMARLTCFMSCSLNQVDIKRDQLAERVFVVNAESGACFPFRP